MELLEKRFKLSERGTTVKTEVLAGITTFMTMAYILFLHPFFMGSAGMDVGAVTVAVILFSALSSFAMGVYANLPYSLAPGMGGNAFLAFTLVKGGICTWQTGMAMVFISGIVFVLLTVFGLREVIVRVVPKCVKLAIGTGIGMFITGLAFKNGKLLVDGSFNMTGTPALLTIIGIFITIFLVANKVKGGLLIGILITTLIGIPMGITRVPESLISLPPSLAPVAFQLDLIGALKLSFIPIMFTFFVGDFFSTLGTLLGVSQKANLLDEDGNLPDIDKPFLVDALATVFGSLFGLTAISTYVESASGVEEGGRTGLTAVVTAICFFLCLFLVPVATMIPASATAGALLLIGLLMATGIAEIDFSDYTEAIPAFFTIAFCTFSFSISNGISAGILSYVFVKVFSGRHKDVHPGMYLLSIPVLYYFIRMAL